jgi:hypothetical protein
MAFRLLLSIAEVFGLQVSLDIVSVVVYDWFVLPIHKGRKYEKVDRRSNPNLPSWAVGITITQLRAWSVTTPLSESTRLKAV